MSGLNNHAVVATLLDPPTSLPVLDIGAGIGNFTAHLQACGYKAVAVDIDPHDYRQAAHSTAPFIEADLDEELPVANESAAGVVAMEVLEHLEAPLRALRHMARAVVPGGFLIVTTPNVMSWGSRLELLVRGHHEHFGVYEFETNGHISPVSLVQLERMAGRLNLRAEHVTYNVGRLPLPKLHQIPLTRPRFRTQGLGESVIVKFRKAGPPLASYMRG